MLKQLLILSLSVWVFYPLAAAGVDRVVSIDENNVAECSNPVSDKTCPGLYRAPSAGDYTVTCKWGTLEEGWGTKLYCIVPHDSSMPVSLEWYYEGGDFQLHLPQGEYTLVFSYDDGRDGMCAFATDFRVDRDMTVQADPSAIVNEVKFKPVMPNGDDMLTPLKGFGDGGLVTIEEGNVELMTFRIGFVTRARYRSFGGSIGMNQRIDYGSLIYNVMDGVTLRCNDTDLLIPCCLFSAVSEEYGALGGAIVPSDTRTGVASNNPDDYKFVERLYGGQLWDVPAENPDFPDVDQSLVSMVHFNSRWLSEGNGVMWDNIVGTDKFPVEGQWICAPAVSDRMPLLVNPSPAKGFYGDLSNQGYYGIFSPSVAVTEDGIQNLACHAHYSSAFNSLDNAPEQSSDIANPWFTYPQDGMELAVYGNNCPTVFFLPIDYGRFYYTFVGRYGEERNIDLMNHSVRLALDGETLCESYTDMRALFGQWGTTPPATGMFELTTVNENLAIDGLIVARNECVMKWKAKAGSGFAPTLQLLQFRENGLPSDRIINKGDATFSFAGGTYTYLFDEDREIDCFDYAPASDITVEYAPHGTSDFAPLAFREIPEKYYMPGWGCYYEGSLDGVDADSPDGWYDVRITLADAHGNSQRQTVSPAFWLAASSVGTVDCDITAGQYFNLQGQLVASPQPGHFYILRQGDSAKKVVVGKSAF